MLRKCAVLYSNHRLRHFQVSYREGSSSTLGLFALQLLPLVSASNSAPRFLSSFIQELMGVLASADLFRVEQTGMSTTANKG